MTKPTGKANTVGIFLSFPVTLHLSGLIVWHLFRNYIWHIRHLYIFLSSDLYITLGIPHLRRFFPKDNFYFLWFLSQPSSLEPEPLGKEVWLPFQGFLWLCLGFPLSLHLFLPTVSSGTYVFLAYSIKRNSMCPTFVGRNLSLNMSRL